jgi:hypothetical protein
MTPGFLPPVFDLALAFDTIPHVVVVPGQPAGCCSLALILCGSGAYIRAAPFNQTHFCALSLNAGK